LPADHWASSSLTAADITKAKSLWTDIRLHRIKTGPLDYSLAVATAYPANAVMEARDFNRIVFKRRNKLVEDFLRKIEPRLVSLQPLLDDHNQAIIFAELSDLPELIPVSQLGQGFSQLLKIISRILAEEAQVVLIDEIENGIHHSVLPVVWKGLAEMAARLKVQIFATTHSWECIVAAHEAFAETLDYDFALHRLERVKDDIQAITYDRAALEAAIQGELEVR
jgi:predicted ATP-dependent endonuclease of OLD family